MAAIKSHKTAVDKTGSWDGPKAVSAAPAEADTLRHMHAWVDAKGDPDKKASYKFPHHESGTDTAAVIKGVNNALARLPQANIPAGDVAGVEAHLRKHRKDAGLEESMSEAEIVEEVKFIKEMNDLKADEAKALQETITLRERSNLAEWLESRLHLKLTEIADDLFGGGNVTRTERIALSGAIGKALDAYHQFLAENAPQLFERRPWDDAPADDGTTPLSPSETSPRVPERQTGGIELREAALAGDFLPLMEKAVRRDGTIPLKIIQPGWGSSGYYPAEVLERDGPKAFRSGLHMYWNHPTLTEETDRPERNLSDLAAVLVSDAKWQPNGVAGAGLYADAKVFGDFQRPVDELAEHIGVSIRALGKAQNGAAEGREGPIITQLTDGKSIDFVTAPGAGGEILNLFEAARTVRADVDPAGTVSAGKATDDVATSESHQEDDMDEKEVKALQEAVATLKTCNETLAADNAKLAERMVLRDASDYVREALSGLDLPEATRKRLISTLPKQAAIKDGKLDEAAFTKTVDEAVKVEVKYLTEVAGLGQIKGLGGSDEEPEDSEAEAKAVESTLESAFGDMGLKESAAKKAAKGRG